MSDTSTPASSAPDYERKIEEARRFLAQRGITEVRPLYGTPRPRRHERDPGRATASGPAGPGRSPRAA
jgi:hypothetical protein